MERCFKMVLLVFLLGIIAALFSIQYGPENSCKDFFLKIWKLMSKKNIFFLLLDIVKFDTSEEIQQTTVPTIIFWLEVIVERH